MHNVGAEFLRAALLFALLTASPLVFGRSQQDTDTGLTETTDSGMPTEPSPDQTSPPAVPSSYDFARAAWASRRLTYQPLSVQAGGGYGIVTGPAADDIHGGANAAVGVSWFPSSALPLALRLDGSYGWFTPGKRLLGSGGVDYTGGERNVYGGDLDLQLDFAHLPSRQKVYLLGGFGWYRVATSLEKLSAAPRVCGRHFCGTYPTVLAMENDTSPWDKSWNAGVGWAMALNAHTSLFVEARFQRIFTRGSNTQFVPIRLGLRF